MRMRMPMRIRPIDLPNNAPSRHPKGQDAATRERKPPRDAEERPFPASEGGGCRNSRAPIPRDAIRGPLSTPERASSGNSEGASAERALGQFGDGREFRKDIVPVRRQLEVTQPVGVDEEQQ
jgi:hypothetical protein